MARHRLTFPNAYDKNGAVARQFGFTRQPYWAVVSPTGQLVRSGFGPRNEEELAQAVLR